MMGFSREHETERTASAQRLVGAGYSAKEAPKTFEHLIAEIRAPDINEPFFFASHPKLQDRVESFNELSRDAANGQLFYEPYILALSDLELAEREYTLSLELAPQFAPPYRALGLLHYKRGEKAPAAPDREYVEAYLKDIGS